MKASDERSALNEGCTTHVTGERGTISGLLWRGGNKVGAYRAAVQQELDAWVMAYDAEDGPNNDEMALWIDGVSAGARATVTALSPASVRDLKAVLDQHGPELDECGAFLGKCACGVEVVGFNEHLALALSTTTALEAHRPAEFVPTRVGMVEGLGEDAFAQALENRLFNDSRSGVVVVEDAKGQPWFVYGTEEGELCAHGPCDDLLAVEPTLIESLDYPVTVLHPTPAATVSASWVAAQVEGFRPRRSPAWLDGYQRAFRDLEAAGVKVAPDA